MQSNTTTHTQPALLNGVTVAGESTYFRDPPRPLPVLYGPRKPLREVRKEIQAARAAAASEA